MRRNRLGSWLLVAFATLAVLAGGVALAQEQTGTVEGYVNDKDGAVLPGVTVEAVSAGGAALVSVTDIKGEYRFPRLASGVYKLTAKLDGFVTAEVPNVNLELGKNLKINFTLQPGTFQDTITVAADTVQIDVSQSQTATSFSREEIALVPHGRDFTSIAAQAAGSGDEVYAGGLSIDGSSGSENRFVIDGIDTSDPQTGVSSQGMVNEFVEEVQVKTSGYAAEYGGSMGGVINAITKTGGNDWHGDVGVYYRNKDMIGDKRPFATRDANGEYSATVYPKDDDTRTEPGFTLSGPILKDKLWFFVGYQPEYRDIERYTVSQDRTTKESITTQNLTANLKGNAGGSFLYKLSYNMSPNEDDGRLAAEDGSTSATADLDVLSKYTANSYSGTADLVLSEKFLISGRLGYFTTDQKDSGFPDEVNVLFNPGPPTGSIPPEYIQPTGYQSNPQNNNTRFDKYERTGASLDASWFVEAAGSHSVKFGVQYEKLANSVDTGEAQNLVRYRWFRGDRFGLGVQGTYGSVEVRRFNTTGDVTSNNLGFFLQDSWSIGKNLTLNIGVRSEKEQVPNYDPAYGKWAIDFGYSDKLAPRFGFAWDVMGDQKLKVYGSYGTYFDITKMEMPRGSFGGDKWISYFYPLENYDWPNHVCDQVQNTTTEDPCGMTFGAPLAEILNLREPSTGANGGIDPNLKPMEQREYQLGADFQLTPQLVVGARYVDRHLVRTIEDMAFFRTLPDGSASEAYIIGNPGQGEAAGSQPEGLPVMPEAKRDYKALELSLNKRFTNNWLFFGSYTYSTLEGNYSGLASSDEFGRTSPNVNRYFDYFHNAFGEQGTAVYGKLNTDRTHQVKLSGVYMFPFKLSVGLNQYYGSGAPISTEYSFGGVPFFAKGRGDQGRLDALTQTDLMLTQSIKLGGFEIQASLNVLNLFDEDTVIRVGTTKYDNQLFISNPNCHNDQLCFFGQTPFDADAVAASEHNPVNPLYMQPIAWQNPMTIRFGLKFIF
jgi:hypothetical protein